MIAVRLIGGNRSPRPTSAFSSRDGYGALVTVSLGDLEISREHRCGEGFAAQNSSQMIIGIGNHQTVPLLTVRWPSGKTQSIDNLTPGTQVIAYENIEESGTGTGFVLRPYQ